MTDISSITQPSAATVRAKAHDARDAVRDLASEATRYAQERAAALKEDAIHYAQDTKTAAVAQFRVARRGTEEFIQRKPYQSLVIAAGVGFVIGLLLKRI